MAKLPIKNKNSFDGFKWKGKRLRTYGEIGDAACALKTEEEGRAFFRAYLAVNPHAAANIGYLMGYYDQETAQRVWRLTGTAHPIFGTNSLTPEELFKAGQELAKYDRG